MDPVHALVHRACSKDSILAMIYYMYDRLYSVVGIAVLVHTADHDYWGVHTTALLLLDTSIYAIGHYADPYCIYRAMVTMHAIR